MFLPRWCSGLVVPDPERRGRRRRRRRWEVRWAAGRRSGGRDAPPPRERWWAQAVGVGPRQPEPTGQEAVAGQHAAGAEHRRRRSPLDTLSFFILLLLPVDRRVDSSTATDQTGDGLDNNRLDLSRKEQAVAVSSEWIPDRWSTGAGKMSVPEAGSSGARIFEPCFSFLSSKNGDCDRWRKTNISN